MKTEETLFPIPPLQGSVSQGGWSTDASVYPWLGQVCTEGRELSDFLCWNEWRVCGGDR